MPFLIGEHAFTVEGVDLVDLDLAFFDLFVLAIDRDDVRDGDGDGGNGRILEALVLDLIEDGAGLGGSIMFENHVDDGAEVFLLDRVL
jgi:hypothetical protein